MPERTNFVDLHQPLAVGTPQSPLLGEFIGRFFMLRYILTPLAALVLLTASLIPDDAYARGRGGGGYRGGGGFHGGGYRGGAVAIRGARGGAVAVRGGRYGHAGYGYRRGVGAAAVGAAAVGAAAVGSYYYRGGCGYDAYGNWVCPSY